MRQRQQNLELESRKSKKIALYYRGKYISIQCQQINYRTIDVHQISSQETPMIRFGNSKALVNYANVWAYGKARIRNPEPEPEPEPEPNK